LSRRIEAYNRQLDLVDELEEQGKILVIRPVAPVVVGRMEKDVEKLEANADDIPSDWTLYFKTDVEVKPDSPKKEYTVKLKDKKE